MKIDRTLLPDSTARCRTKSLRPPQVLRGLGNARRLAMLLAPRGRVLSAPVALLTLLLGCSSSESFDSNQGAVGAGSAEVPAPRALPSPQPCVLGAVRQCAVPHAGVGICASGTETCVPATAGDSTRTAWGQCLGATVARAEVCNGLDDDCDGEVDEGIECRRDGGTD